MNETFYLPGLIPVKGHLLSCSKCGRKILVEIGLCGVSHNVSVHAVCATCVSPSDEFVKTHPDITKQITEWAETKPPGACP